MLAGTGVLMVWLAAMSPEYGKRLALSAQAMPQSITDQAAAALASHPDGKIGQYMAPYSATNPAIFRVDPDASQQMIAVNPDTGEILRDTANGNA